MGERKDPDRVEDIRRWRHAEEIRARLNDHRTLGIGIVLTILLSAAAFSRLEVIAREGLADPVLDLSLLLLVAVFVLVVQWYVATERELPALLDIGDEFVEALPASELPLVIAAAIGLGGLAVASAWPLAFAIGLTLFKVIELCASFPLHRQIRRAIRKGQAKGFSELQKQAVPIVEEYYLEKPWIQLGTVILAVAAFGMALAAYYQGLASPYRTLALCLVSIGLFAAIVGGELVVARWRRAYFRTLTPVLEEIKDDRAVRRARLR